MAKTKNIELPGGRSLHAVTAGEGPDVLLLHGALETAHDWMAAPFDGMVAEGFRVTAVDRPGHGESRRRRFDGTPRSQAEQIREGLGSMGVERPIIVSHSYGSLVSLAFAELFPSEVAALVLVAPLAFPEPRLLEHSLLAPRSVPLLGPLFSSAADATIDRPMLKLIQKLMFAPQPVPAAWEESFPYERILDPEAMVFEGEDSAAILPGSPAGLIEVAAIKTPAHIITGTQDKIVDPNRQARRLARLMPNARLTELEGIGHMPHQIRPDLILEAVKEALAPA